MLINKLTNKIQILSLFASYPELKFSVFLDGIFGEISTLTILDYVMLKAHYVALRYFKISHNMLCYILLNRADYVTFNGIPLLCFVMCPPSN